MRLPSLVLVEPPAPSFMVRASFSPVIVEANQIHYSLPLAIVARPVAPVRRRRRLLLLPPTTWQLPLPPGIMRALLTTIHRQRLGLDAARLAAGHRLSQPGAAVPAAGATAISVWPLLTPIVAEPLPPQPGPPLAALLPGYGREPRWVAIATAILVISLAAQPYFLG
ncbi:hypothetical protein NL676_034171 [Syzygium grande]|nr:hypothetical protein NL676_034171 [Syzygium grande]